MKICVCYIAVTNGPFTTDYAARFATTHHEYQPGVEHDTLVICNGGPLKQEQGALFSHMSARFYPRKNDEGYDISGYIDAAKGPCKDYDLMLCLGESNYFHRAGWLKRIVEAWDKHGPGMYGPFGTNVIRTHLQTTAFAVPPRVLQEYPFRVDSKKARYEFEHGEHGRCLWRRLAVRKLQVRLVTWDGEWTPEHFRAPPNVLWRGDQSNLLWFANHSDHYRDANETRKASWSRSADRPFK